MGPRYYFGKLTDPLEGLVPRSAGTPSSAGAEPLPGAKPPAGTDPFASAEHAVLTFRGRAWYVEDLESTNGSFVNGVPVERVAPLGFGDELQVGEVRFRLDRGRA